MAITNRKNSGKMAGQGTKRDLRHCDKVPMAFQEYRMAILKRGLSGEPVRWLQAQLAVEADGEFGPKTEKVLMDWQKKNGLAADGVAGRATLAHIEAFQGDHA
jgi:peptidoglycan hydrolase-like protein with peptidoglycan-binding domain